MAEVSEIEAGGEVRIVKDATARQGVAANANAIAGSNEKIPAAASASNKMATARDVSEVIPTSQTGNPSQKVAWSRWGKVVVLTISGEFTDGQQIDLPFTPLAPNSNILFWGSATVGWMDITVTKKAIIHVVSGPSVFGTITYITSDNVY